MFMATVPAADATAGQWRRHVLMLAMPVMISNSTVPLVGIVDTAVMGRMGSPEWVAATAVGAVIFSSVYWIFGFLRMATGGLVAQSLGADDHETAGRVTIRALVLASFFSALLFALQTPLLAIGLLAMDDNAQWQELTATYFSIRICSAPATLFNYAIIGTLVGLQRMRAVLLLQLLLNLMNVFLNIGFFNYTDWNIRGVATATVISEYIAALTGLWLLRHSLIAALRKDQIRSWLFNRADLTRYFSISSDLFIRTLCLTFAYYWMTVLSSRQGVVILAANTVLLHMIHFSTYCMDGFSDATESLTGFAVGRKSTALLRRSVRAACELGLVAALFFSLVFTLGGDFIIQVMVTDSQSQASAAMWLPWVIITPIISIWSFLLDGIFIGSTQTASMRNSMLVSLPLFMLTATIAVPVLGNTGIWIAYFVLLIARTLTLTMAWPRVVAVTQKT